MTWKAFVQICNDKKPSPFKHPVWEDVYQELSTRLGVPNNELLHENVRPLRERYFKLKKSSQKKWSADRPEDSDEIVLRSEDLSTSDTIIATEPPKKRKTKSIDQLGEKQTLRRTDDLWNMVQEFSAENNETPLRILSLLLQRCGDKHARQFGKEVWMEGNDSTKKDKLISVDAALSIKADCNLGREKYYHLRKNLKNQGYDILPPWTNLVTKERKITPETQQLTYPKVGVHYSFTKSMALTTQRIVEDEDPSRLPSSAVLDIKFGCDGSGSHAIYRQVNNAQTNNMVMTMFCPLKLKTDEGDVLWEQKTPNNPLTHRPLLLEMGKESVESIGSLAIFNDEQTELKTNGCLIKVGEAEMLLKVNNASTMMDMKAAHLYLGVGGAYCDLCDTPRKLAHDPSRVKEGFDISRHVESLHNLFEDLVQEDGSVYKSRNDYEERAGLTSKPVPTNETKSVQVLHALLRCFDHFMKVAVHLKAAVFDWSESPTSVNNLFLKQAKAEIQAHIEVIVGEKWDIPDGTGKGGTTTTGNTARRLLHQHRDVVINLVPENYQNIMHRFGQHLSVILRLFCSSKSINVHEYKKLCTDLYVFILESFPHVNSKPGTWVSITPSLHKLLGHSWELIESNDSRGLKNLDESGLEGNNKILRSIRLNLARKTSQEANLEDTIRRMWVGSDPKINNIRLKTRSYCKHCKEHGHSTRYCKINKPVFGPLTDDDALFDSMLIV